MLNPDTFVSVGALLGFSSLFISAAVLYAQPPQSTEAAVAGYTTSAHNRTRAGWRTEAASNHGLTLKDAAARPVSGVASVTFAIYNEQDNGTALWSETQNVLADTNGHYTILLGAATANGVPANLFGTGESRWLGVTIARQQEMPRVLMASVPYALKAGDADTLGGLPASSYVTTQQLAARPAVSSVSGPSTILASTNAAPSVIDATITGSGTTNSPSSVDVRLKPRQLSAIPDRRQDGARHHDSRGNSRYQWRRNPPRRLLRVSGGHRNGRQRGQTVALVPVALVGIQQLLRSTAVNPVFGFRAIPLNNNTSHPLRGCDLLRSRRPDRHDQ